MFSKGAFLIYSNVALCMEHSVDWNNMFLFYSNVALHSVVDGLE